MGCSAMLETMAVIRFPPAGGAASFHDLLVFPDPMPNRGILLSGHSGAQTCTTASIDVLVDE